MNCTNLLLVRRRSETDLITNNFIFYRHRQKRGVCDILDIGSGACSLASSVSGVCNPYDWLEDKLNSLGDEILTLVGSIENFFEFTINSDFGLSGNVNISKNASTVLAEVEADILAKTEGVRSFLTSVTNIIGLTLIFLFIKSLHYIKNYRTKDYYDNIYITRSFLTFDQECEKRKQEVVMPLQPRELQKFVLSFSPHLSEVERRTIKYELKLLAYHLLIAVLTIVFDYILYYALNLITEYGDVALTVEGVSTIDVTIDSEGIFGVILRAMVDTIDLNSTFSVEFNFTTCLPSPSIPNVWYIPALLILYVIALCLVIMQGYGMRFRHYIAASFYPEQEEVRIHYLHEKILHERFNIGTWLKDLVLSRLKGGQVRERLRFRTYLAYKSPCFAQWCAACMPEERTCLSCDRVARRGMIFKKCQTESCKAVYCEECFDVMKQFCLVCETRNEIDRAG